MLRNEILAKIAEKFSKAPLIVEGANGSLGLSLLNVLLELNIEIPYLILTTKKSEPDASWIRVSNNINALKATDENFIGKRYSEIIKIQSHFNVFFSSGYGRPNLFLNEPKEILTTNIDSLLGYSEFDNIDMFAYMSTSEIYSGLNTSAYEDIPIVSSTQQQRSIYIEAKRLGEAITKNLLGHKSNRAVSYRIALATPPTLLDNDNRVLADLINCGKTQNCVTLNGGANLVRQYQYGPNAIYKILGSLVNGSATLYNNAGSHVLTLGQLAQNIAKILNVDCEVKEHTRDTSSPQSVLIDTGLIDLEAGYQIKLERSFEHYLRKIICSNST